jgi:hypothetical protein
MHAEVAVTPEVVVLVAVEREETTQILLIKIL